MTAAWRSAVAAALGLALAWALGGQALLGRIDPALAFPMLILPMLLLAWWQRADPRQLKLRSVAATLALLLAAQAMLAWWLSDAFAWKQLLLILMGGALAAWLADLVLQRRGGWRRILLAAALAIGWFGAGHALLAALYASRLAADPRPVVMLTGLPLRWAGEGDLAAMVARGADEDPALMRIEATGPLDLVDSLADHPPPAGSALLLAHPRALAAQDLVAIDAFVRGGGDAVILADALSGWPIRHPLGDPRNPPVTSLLTALLAHWGITLAAAPVGERAARSFDLDGERVRLFSAGRFEVLPRGCRAFAGRRIARCPIGKGTVWLVGDADLLFAPLWQPLVPGAAHLRCADTMEWLDARLRGAAMRGAVLRPLWIRAD
ncbi:GldG family protein [Sphingopyxis indica]|uniref:Gldg family protein n=1 Tax=Sphingopyxis indica TaxID=436663 RepID=UPI00293909C1|nr:hypothetical protein [Sphingopyxis indica]WOF44476.1 GldG family protein [Sphingopyxis indica]